MLTWILLITWIFFFVLCVALIVTATIVLVYIRQGRPDKAQEFIEKNWLFRYLTK